MEHSRLHDKNAYKCLAMYLADIVISNFIINIYIKLIR